MDKKRNVGIAFPDYIGFEQYTRKRRNDDNADFSAKHTREFLLPLVVVFVIGILFVRLFHVQILQGNYYRTLSDTNRIRTTVLYAPRGIMFDRNGMPLVYNLPGFRTKVGDKTILFSHEQALELLAKGRKDIAVDSLRQYPYKEALAHVLGYIGQITKEELESEAFSVYHPGDLLGKSGIEQQYEGKLKGIDGKQLSEVDATGKVIRTLGQTDPIPGEDITLTLDSKLQVAIDGAMQYVKKGAVVVSTPRGEILSLVSKPSYDPNLFTLGDHYKASDSGYITVEQVLFDAENQPLLNRAVAGVYPPGSTFKLITAASGLENGDIDEHFIVTDTGVLTIGAFSFANWYFTQYGKTEGEVDVVKGIARSNDIFFYKLAEEVGVERLSKTAEAFGLGKRLGIDLVGEAKGIVPSDAWKKEVIGEPWYLGDTYHYGIGQGYLLTTPLQVNSWTQVIANGGTLYQPRLIKNTTNTTNTTNKPMRNNLISEKTRKLIREGMIASCSSGGVAWPLFKLKIKNEKLKIDGKNFLEPTEATVSAQFNQYREIRIACKTGTAQHGGKEDLPHAWITLFAPAYDPQIIVTVLAEASGEGSNIAAPVAKKILEAWFSGQ